MNSLELRQNFFHSISASFPLSQVFHSNFLFYSILFFSLLGSSIYCLPFDLANGLEILCEQKMGITTKLNSNSTHERFQSDNNNVRKNRARMQRKRMRVRARQCIIYLCYPIAQLLLGTLIVCMKSSQKFYDWTINWSFFFVVLTKND